MADYYSPQLTAASRALCETMRRWAEETGDVSIVGGWAVAALVDPEAALPSRDVDLVLRTPKAQEAFQRRAAGWGLEPVAGAREGTYAFKDDPTGTLRVDVYVPQKPLSFSGVLPPVSWLLHDTLATIKERTGEDALIDQGKDLLDLHRLVFHNREATPPLRLLPHAPADLRRHALGQVEGCIAMHPGFAQDYRKIAQWLRHA